MHLIFAWWKFHDMTWLLLNWVSNSSVGYFSTYFIMKIWWDIIAIWNDFQDNRTRTSWILSLKASFCAIFFLELMEVSLLNKKKTNLLSLIMKTKAKSYYRICAQIFFLFISFGAELIYSHLIFSLTSISIWK